tara:strand:- start:70 stop:996 length:927 start_codon:yes stop_codon:yes gene_type:complete
MNKYILRLLIILTFIPSTFCQNISGKVFFNYSKPGNKDDISSFGIKRTYLTVEKKVSVNIAYKFQADIDYKSSPQNIYVKNAKVDWITDQGKVVIGLQGMNMFKIQETTWGKRYIEKSSMDQFKYSSSADMGLGFYKSTNDISISALITNGSGYKKAENDDHKKISLQGIYGQQKLDKNDGFNIGSVYSTESYDLDSSSVKNISVIGLFGGYASNGIRVGLELNQKNDNGLDIKGQLMSLYANYQTRKNIALFLKYDMVSPNTKESDEDKTYLIAGIEYSPGKGLMISPNFRKTDDNSQLILNFEFKF